MRQVSNVLAGVVCAMLLFRGTALNGQEHHSETETAAAGAGEAPPAASKRVF